MAELSKDEILAEFLARNSTPLPTLVDPTFKAQAELISDPAKLKVGFCTRRSGKSYGAGLYLVKEALENPGVSCLYIALTRDEAKRIFWKDVLKTINRKFKLGIKFNETLLTATLSNGSVIYLLGVNSSEEEKEKLLGQKYKLAVIDEAASFTINLRDLVYSVLKPAMVDLSGTILMIGTPSNITRGLFYDVTVGKEPGWSVHRWSAFDNPYMAKKWAAEIEEIRKSQPLLMETPSYKQNYLGLWEVDESKLVYKYDPARNDYESLPDASYHYVLGVDLGYQDDTAFSVLAYSDHDPTLYVVEAQKQKGMDVTSVATRIKALDKRYGFDVMVCDGANKQAVEEIRNRHQLPLQAAKKEGKADFIEIMSSELIQARVRVHSTNSFPLIDEWKGLVWVTKADEIVIPRRENPRCPNHLADATLYAWRYCYTYLFTPKAAQISPHTPEWFHQQQEEMERAAYEAWAANADPDVVNPTGLEPSDW